MEGSDEVLCSRCKKKIAVIYVTKMEGEKQTNEGLCMSCAKDLGIKPVDDMLQQMGLDPHMIEEGMNELMESNPELAQQLEQIPDGTAPNFDFIHRIFAKSGFEQEDGPGEEKSTQTGQRPPKEKQEKQEKQKKRKALESYGINLNQKAQNGLIDRVVGREKEIMRVIQILNRRTKNNPVLLGSPGVGKTAIAEGLALRIVEQNVPAKLLGYEVYLVDFAALVAGTQFRGQFEARLKNLLDEAKALGNIILVIDEVHNITGAGEAEGAMNAANILKPSLARGEIQVIGATTLEEYRKYIEKDSALERRFQPVMVDEPSIEDSIEILKGIKGYYESYHKVSISDDIIRSAVILSEQYIHDRFLPDKAIDIIDESASKVNLKNNGLIELAEIRHALSQVQEEKESAISSDSIEDYQKAASLKIKECRLLEQIAALEKTCCAIPVTIEDVADVIEQWSKIPVARVTESDSDRLLHLEERLHKRIVGQEKAVDTVSRAIRRRRVGLSLTKRPVSFIFAGPTGVGKTELVKAISANIFGSEEALIRLDMSEYMEKHAVSKIIGSPPGYVGYDDAGQLTEKVRRNPYSVILLDEIEKAHSDVLNILLQILDDGRITDSHGKTVYFHNTIIVMTTNAGSDLKSGVMGFAGIGEIVSKYEKTLRDLMRPEFLNRIDEIVEFLPLTSSELMEVTMLMLGELEGGLLEQNIKMTITDSAKKWLLQKGFDPKYGARPLRRTIARYIEDKAAEMFLRGSLKPGDVLKVDAGAEDLILTV